MAKSIQAPTVGSQFTTQKSGTVGTVQEVIKNASGSYRVRLTVEGQDRWTTVKQFNKVCECSKTANGLHSPSKGTRCVGAR